MISFLKKSIYFLIFIAFMYAGIVQANNIAPILLEYINMGGILFIFYPNAFTDLYIYLYKNLNSILIVSIFLLHYFILRKKLQKNILSVALILFLYLINDILAFSGFYWNKTNMNIFIYIYIAVFTSFSFLVLLKLFIIKKNS